MNKQPIAFFCENCGSEVNDKTIRCPNCGRRLGGVKCPRCKHIGVSEEFVGGCPKCHLSMDEKGNPIYNNDNNFLNTNNQNKPLYHNTKPKSNLWNNVVMVTFSALVTLILVYLINR